MKLMKLFTVSLALVGITGLANADLRSEITTMNTKICQMMMKGDMKSLDAMMKAGMTSNFQYVEGGKTMTYAQMFEQMKASMSMMKCTSATSKLASLKQNGKTATSVEKHMMAGTMTGPDKKPHKMSFSGTSTNTYVLSGKMWKMSKMSWGESKMMMDGKPMDPSKMGG